jgi:hypothetical protein
MTSYRGDCSIEGLYKLCWHDCIQRWLLNRGGFTTTYAISVYHHWCCEFESWSGRDVQHYVIKFVSDLRQVGGFLWVLRFPSPINWPPRYNWNVVESGHQANKQATACSHVNIMYEVPHIKQSPLYAVMLA